GEPRGSSVRVTRSYTFNDAEIVCHVELAESAGNKVFLLYGGPHGLREYVSDAYEMLPLIKSKVPGPKVGRKAPPPEPTGVTAIDVDGKAIGPVGENPTEAASVLIDRGGFGARIVLDKPRPVLLGKHNTLLIQLAGERTHVSQIGLDYTIVPFEGDGADLASAPAAEKPKLAKLPAIDSLDKVAAALAEQKPSVIKTATHELAQVRFAIAGDQFAIDAHVVDSAVKRETVVWKGSCLEVFGSAGQRAPIGQVFLAPEAPGASAGGFRPGKKIEPATEIRVQSKPVEKGYELQALVPLSMLALDPAATEAWLEFQLGATPTPDPKGRPKNKPGLQHATLFGSLRAYEDNS